MAAANRAPSHSMEITILSLSESRCRSRMSASLFVNLTKFIATYFYSFPDLQAPGSRGFWSRETSVIAGHRMCSRGIRGLYLQKCNHILTLNIEPAMIPRATELLNDLQPVIDEGFDFIFSIGAGDSEQAYQNRIDITSVIFHTLDDICLKQVIFRLHQGRSANKQAGSLQYGSAAASSIEILHYKPDPSAVKRLHPLT